MPTGRSCRANGNIPGSRPAQDGFTIADDVSLSPCHLRVPKIGWLRLKGANPYAGGKPLQARIRKEGTAIRSRWYAYIVYAVPAVPVHQVKPWAQTGVLGLDRNVGQATDSTGTVHCMTNQARLNAQIKRHQRCLARKKKGSARRRRIAGQLTRLHRKRQRIRDNDMHRISRTVADTAHTVVIKDLQTQGMTRSAQGTVERLGSAGTQVDL